MWFEGSRLDSVRHECKHEDDIKKWGWSEFDAKGYGKQRLVDIHNFVQLDMDYVQKNNDWMIRINGSSVKKGKSKHAISLIFYYGVSGKEGSIEYPSLSKREKQQVFVFVSNCYDVGN